MSGSRAWLLPAILAVSAGCDELPPTPFTAAAPSPVVVSSPRQGVPIDADQIVTGTITPADPSCGNEGDGDPPEPCRLFVFTPRDRGILTVRASTSGTGPLSLRVNQERDWGQEVRIRVAVRISSRYEIGVALHDGPHAASQRFELVTTFEQE